MYKIHRLLLLLTLVAPFNLLGQQASNRPLTAIQTSIEAIASPNHHQSAPAVDHSAMRQEVYQQTSRKTVFTVHRLAGLVEPGKKHAYDASIEGQKVSLPYPIPFQIQNQHP